jgi:hypothetical protein
MRRGAARELIGAKQNPVITGPLAAGRRRDEDHCHDEPTASGKESLVSAPVRIGLAGYGLGGRFYHAPLIASAENCEFLGVVTTSPERRRQVAEDLGRPVLDTGEHRRLIA